MKSFTQWEVEEAVAYAMAGGQALHLHRFIVDRRRAPRCFVRAVDAGEDIAHLFDQDRERLEATCRKLGVNVIVVEREGEDSQHIDLCGAPLKRALTQCDKDELAELQDRCRLCGKPVEVFDLCGPCANSEG